MDTNLDIGESLIVVIWLVSEQMSLLYQGIILILCARMNGKHMVTLRHN